MSKLKKLFPLLMVFALFCLGLSPVQGSAETLDSNSTSPTNEEMQSLADELEYLFTTILVKDETTGIYTVNEEELNKSSYTAEEKAQLLDAAAQMKARGTFDRCMQDLIGISATVWNEIKGYIEAEQYLAAAGALLALPTAIKISPILLGIFVLTCGPSSAG